MYLNVFVAIYIVFGLFFALLYTTTFRKQIILSQFTYAQKHRFPRFRLDLAIGKLTFYSKFESAKCPLLSSRLLTCIVYRFFQTSTSAKTTTAVAPRCASTFQEVTCALASTSSFVAYRVLSENTKSFFLKIKLG